MEKQQLTGEMKRGMKWYKFLIYFYLWFQAAGHIIEAVMMFTGAVYTLSGAEKAQIYSEYPGLKSVDLYAGIIFLVLALVAFSVRGKLKKKTKGGVGNFYAYLALWLMADVIYIILFSYMTGAKPPVMEVGVIALIWAAFFGLNFWYFKTIKNFFIFFFTNVVI